MTDEYTVDSAGSLGAATCLRASLEMSAYTTCKRIN